MGPGRYTDPFLHDQEEENSDSMPENGPDSPSSGDEARTAPPAPSPKKRKGLQKRVISVPIMGSDQKHHGDSGSNKIKGKGSSSSSSSSSSTTTTTTTYPPSDSWAWRKYGQKPIKGSPYPRGYYRCSGSKGCPAKKQVERSRLDPTVLLITYSDHHNHPFPAPKHRLPHHHHHHHHQHPTKSEPEDSTSASISASAGEFVATDIREDSLIDDPDFHWVAESASAISYPRGPIYAGSDCAASASAFSMGEEDESLFGGLGELPECSLVFRLGMSAVPCTGHAG